MLNPLEHVSMNCLVQWHKAQWLSAILLTGASPPQSHCRSDDWAGRRCSRLRSLFLLLYFPNLPAYASDWSISRFRNVTVTTNTRTKKKWLEDSRGIGHRKVRRRVSVGSSSGALSRRFRRPRPLGGHNPSFTFHINSQSGWVSCCKCKNL